MIIFHFLCVIWPSRDWELEGASLHSVLFLAERGVPRFHVHGNEVPSGRASQARGRWPIRMSWRRVSECSWVVLYFKLMLMLICVNFLTFQGSGSEGACVLQGRGLAASVPAEIPSPSHSPSWRGQCSGRLWHWILWWGGHKGNQGLFLRETLWYNWMLRSMLCCGLGICSPLFHPLYSLIWLSIRFEGNICFLLSLKCWCHRVVGQSGFSNIRLPLVGFLPSSPRGLWWITLHYAKRCHWTA